MNRALVAVAALLLVAACRPKPKETSATAGAAAVAVRAPGARVTDPEWIAARDEDLAVVMRLAAAEGAAGLLIGVEDGGETATTALRALPYAEDAESALGPLGALLGAASSEQQGMLLTAILEIAGQPRRPREPLDPEGARACGDAVISFASRTDAPRENRAMAVSAARALAEKGLADPRKIPGDLDPN